MTWISIDPAEKTGIAVWTPTALDHTATMRPASVKEAKGHGWDRARAVSVVGTLPGTRTFPSQRAAWLMLLGDAKAVVIEESFGDSPKTVAQMGERRGYVAAICDSLGIPCHFINTSEWRKVCGDRLNASWPAKSKDAKQRSIDLAREHYQIEVSGDEGDAIWIGRAALWLGLVKP